MLSYFFLLRILIVLFFFFQPAFLVAVITLQEDPYAQVSEPSTKKPSSEADLTGLKKADILDAFLQFVRKSDGLIKR